MKFNAILAAALTLGCALSSHAAPLPTETFTFITDAMANSTTNGVGATSGAGVYVTAGSAITFATAEATWHGADDGNYAVLSTDANGAVGTYWSVYLNGAGTVPIGALVGDIGGVYELIGAGTTTLNAWGTGELFLEYADINNYDNSGTQTSQVTVAVPEPTNVALLLAGLGMMGVVARRRSPR